jgi:hypothetical protein
MMLFTSRDEELVMLTRQRRCYCCPTKPTSRPAGHDDPGPQYSTGLQASTLWGRHGNRREQTPWESSSLLEDFAFVPAQA